MKKKKLKIVKLFLLSLLVFSVIPIQIWAAICQPPPIVPCGQTTDSAGTPYNETGNCQFCHIFILINNVISLVLTCLAPVVAGLMLMIGGFYFLTAGGNPSTIGKAKTAITAVVIGFVIIFFAWVFLNTFLDVIGVAEWTGLREGWWNINCPVP